MDTQHGAWHAGSSKWNHKSIGVEITNAFYTKHQDWYVRNGFGERPIIDDAYVHGSKLETHLGFYDVQKQALAALWDAINKATGIPLEVPTDDNGHLVEAVDSKATRGTFKGFVNHYNLTKRKIDCAGLDLLEICDQAKKQKQ
jgi:RNAse (barnase) inhibitor barstar